MSTNIDVDALQEKDITTTIQEFADEAFEPKKDLKDTKIRLPVVKPHQQTRWAA